MADISSPPASPGGMKAQKAFEAAVGAENVFFTALDRDTYEDKFAIDHAPYSAGRDRALRCRRGAGHRKHRRREQGAAVADQPRQEFRLRRGGAGALGLGRPRHVAHEAHRARSGKRHGAARTGVGFYDLYDYLTANNIPLWLSVPGNSWGSVAGNALDRGVGYTPYGENTSKICGMEVVLADGDIVRTGMGAAKGTPSWQLYRYGFGPAWDQLFVQSNFGIVTKVGMWLMPEPESVVGMDVEFDKPEDIESLIDALGPLRREGLLQQNPTIGNWLRAAAVLTKRTDWTDKPGALSDDVIDAIRKKFHVGWWGVGLRLYGRESVTRASYAILEKAMKDLKPMSFKPAAWKRGEPIPPSPWQGVPITFPMENTGWYGGRGGHIGFSPVLPQSGKLALEQFHRTYARYKEFGMDYQASFAFGERHLINVNAMILNKDDPKFMAKVDPFLRTLIADARKQGYCEYRTHLDYMDTVAATYDFNNHALLRLNERVKNALDPHGIIAPGKSGIWPAVYKKERSL